MDRRFGFRFRGAADALPDPDIHDQQNGDDEPQAADQQLVVVAVAVVGVYDQGILHSETLFAVDADKLTVDVALGNFVMLPAIRTFQFHFCFTPVICFLI